MHTSAVRPRPRRANRPSPPFSAPTTAPEPPRPIYPWATPRAVTLNDAETAAEAADAASERRRQGLTLAVMVAIGVAITVLLVLVLGVATQAPARLP